MTNLQAEESVFFSLLKSPPYDKLYKNWADQQFTILIPPDNEVQYILKKGKFGSSQLMMFIKGHILKESPFFVGQFTNEADKTVQESVEPNRPVGKAALTQLFRKSSMGNLLEEKKMRYLKTSKGFEENFVVEVKHEEIFYNREYKPYKIWHIDRCLHDRHKEIQEAAEKEVHISNDKVQKRDPETIEEFHQFLENLNSTLYVVLRKQIDTFNRSYMLLNGYHMQAIQKINQYYQQIVDEYIQSNQNLESNSNLNLTLKLAINSVLVDGVYAKFYPYWQRAFLQEERKLSEEIQLLQDRSMEDFGIPIAFQHDQFAAIQVLRKLPSQSTPLGKLKILKSVTHTILASIPASSPRPEALTSDELLPLLAFVITRSKIPYLTAECEFMTHLQIRELEMAEYGFALVSFQAALQFLHHESPSVIAPDNEKKKSMIKAESPGKSDDEAVDGLYRAMTMPESYFKVMRRSLSPRQTVDDNVDRRKSLSSEVIKSFEKRLQDSADSNERFVGTETVLYKTAGNTWSPGKISINKKRTNPQLGDLLSSLLDSD